MAAVKLEVQGVNDSLDLTSYLDVEQGKGMEPGDPHFTNKVFAHSLLKPGGTLALEDLQLKEMVFPLKLKAATKPALAELVQRLNKILTTAGTQVEWRDEGITNSTFFDLAAGQFDDEYNYWLGRNQWLVGKLRLFAQPLGFGEEERAGVAQKVKGVATTTAVGTSPVVTFPIASAFPGDAAALIRGTLTVETTEPLQLAMSVIPASSYGTVWPIASLSSLTAGSTGATTNAIQGNYIRLNESIIARQELSWTIPSAAYQYIGEHRVLAIARAASPHGIDFHYAGALISTATVTQHEWAPYDMGVISGASSILQFGPKLNIGKSQGATSNGLDVTGLILLPESSTVWLNTLPGNHSAERVVFDGVGNFILQTKSSPIEDLTGLARGAIPNLPVGQEPIVAFFGVKSNAAINRKLQASVSLVARTRYIF